MSWLCMTLSHGPLPICYKQDDQVLQEEVIHQGTSTTCKVNLDLLSRILFRGHCQLRMNRTPCQKGQHIQLDSWVTVFSAAIPDVPLWCLAAS